MADAAVVGRILREYHLRDLKPEAIRRLGGSVRGTQVSYRVSHDGPPLVIRAFRTDAPVPVQFSGSAAETMSHWVTGRAGTLASLAAAGYPAPRPVASRTGDLVGVAGPWLTWATSYVEGPVLAPSLEQLRLLGRALGVLHAEPFDITGSRQGQPGPPAEPAQGHPRSVPGLAAWHPAAAVAGTLRRLRAVAPMLPAGWRDMHAAFRATAEAVQRRAAELPEALVHGDAWPGNAVQPRAGWPGWPGGDQAGAGRPGGGPVMLIDWDTAGLGLPVLDLGNCLAECHLDSGLPPDRPEAWLVRPDAHRIAAVASGYREVRELTGAEREVLPEAVRFGAAFAGAIHCEAALTGGASGPAMDARLARLRNRLEISAEVARLALRHL
jgi:Ser/Thr protein kinase RdoA (MazF antagonist)